MKKRRQRAYILVGLALMFFLYSVYYLAFIYRLAPRIPLKARHVIKLLFILAAYFTGWVILRKTAPGWILGLWKICYGGVAGLLLIFGGFDWFIYRTPPGIRGVADDLQDLLISPALLVVMLLMMRLVQRNGL